MSGVNSKNNKYSEAIRLFEDERKIDPEVLFETLKESIVKAYQKFIDAPEAKVRVEADAKGLRAYHQLDVVENDYKLYDETLDIYLKDAQLTNPDIKVGDIVEQEIAFDQISRTATNVVKQMLRQKTKESEKKKVYETYKDREFDLISGVIKTVERRNDKRFLLVDLQDTLAYMGDGDLIPDEQYREGSPIRAIIKNVSENSKGCQVELSRSDPKFVERLFEKEVPEIQQGLVEIKAIAREAGDRTKMAVYSRNEDVDAIGSCIGPRGTRVQAVISEIKNEKIDVFEWNDDVCELVKNALSPAEVKACFYSNPLINDKLTEEDIEKDAKRNKRPLVVVVEEHELSNAIGKSGKNVKLAVKLTGRKIDIKTESSIRELGIDIEKEEAEFKADQARIKKEKEQKEFLSLQEEAAKRKEAFDQEVAENDTGVFEETIEEMDEKPVEVTIEDEPNVESLEEAENLAKEEEEEKAKEEVEEEPKHVKQAKKLVPHTDYVSKFEDIAGGSKKEEKAPVKKRKKKDDEDRRLRAEDLEKKEYDDDVKPTYSEEELEEIRQQEEELEENSWINDDDIDFDEYDEYYDEEK